MKIQRKLPFFKFDAAAWLLGKIQILSREDKGTFIDIIATIWYENGQVKNDRFLASKLKVSSTDLQGTLSNLEDLGIIYKKDNFLRVKFIDRLLDERSEFIEKCSKNGKKSAMQRKVPSTKQKAESRKQKAESRDKKEENTPYNHPAGDNVDENNFSLSDCKLPIEVEKSKFEKRFDIVKSRIHKLYSRRESTEWSKDEIKKLKEICKRPDCDLELADIEKFYAYCEKQYWKQNIVTLLNQWGNEVDRARLKNSCAFNQTGNDGFPKLKVSI